MATSHVKSINGVKGQNRQDAAPGPIPKEHDHISAVTPAHQQALISYSTGTCRIEGATSGRKAGDTAVCMIGRTEY